jgi:competence ComEA-like helix-hairpin-helix protein
MTLTRDEHRALAFIAALLCLSAVVRVVHLPATTEVPGEPLDLDAHIAATERVVAEAERMAEPLRPGERIDPNTAPLTELARLPRVGPALARRILEDREARGPFRTTGDLARVPGVGPRLLELAAPHLDLPDGPPTPAIGAGPAGVAGPVATPRGATAAPTPPTGTINLNTADAATLESLPGVGPVLAARIIAHRDAVGGFTSPDDLLAVRGIGEATLARLRHRVRADP